MVEFVDVSALERLEQTWFEQEKDSYALVIILIGMTRLLLNLIAVYFTGLIKQLFGLGLEENWIGTHARFIQATAGCASIGFESYCGALSKC